MSVREGKRGNEPRTREMGGRALRGRESERRERAATRPYFTRGPHVLDPGENIMEKSRNASHLGLETKTSFFSMAFSLGTHTSY